MDKYLQALELDAKMKLDKHIAFAIEAFNAIGKEQLEDIVVATNYKEYAKVLLVKYTHGKMGVLNIDMNSTLATARSLATYLYRGATRTSCCIEEVFRS